MKGKSPPSSSLTASLFLLCSSRCLSRCFCLLSESSVDSAGEGVAGGVPCRGEAGRFLPCSSFFRCSSSSACFLCCFLCSSCCLASSAYRRARQGHSR